MTQETKGALSLRLTSLQWLAPHPAAPLVFPLTPRPPPPTAPRPVPVCVVMAYLDVLYDVLKCIENKGHDVNTSHWQYTLQYISIH
jgi:hypothetical protein